MYADMKAVLQGIKDGYDATTEAQQSTAFGAISTVGTILPLSEAWTANNYAWVINYMVDLLASNQKNPETGEYQAQNPLGPTSALDPFYRQEAQQKDGYTKGYGPAMIVTAQLDNIMKGMGQQQMNTEVGELTSLAEKIKGLAELLGTILTGTIGNAADVWSLLSLTQSLTKNLKS